MLCVIGSTVTQKWVYNSCKSLQFSFIDILHSVTIIFLLFFMFILTCAANGSIYRGGMNFYKLPLQTLSQCITCFAFNCILLCVREKINLKRPPTAQLSAHHCCFILVPELSTNRLPPAIVEILYNSIATSGSANKSQIPCK